MVKQEWVTGTARGQINQFVHVGWTVEFARWVDVDGLVWFDYNYLEFEISKSEVHIGGQ
jgi:hypothetical protein